METGINVKEMCIRDRYKEDGSQVSVDTAKVNDYMNHFSGLNWVDFVSYDVSDLACLLYTSTV